MGPNGRAEYYRAMRMGEKASRSEQAKGHYPYLPALDGFLQNSDVKTEISLGLVDIPLDLIVGTKTVGRSNAFAPNFMPLMHEKSEFAMKWASVYDYQEEEGITDPIVCYEFMNRFYVLEGNKRVSVLKYLGATSIEGRVTRLVPHRSDNPENRIFYEFMEFYRHTQINYVSFSKEGRFASLTRLCGKGPDEDWTEDERKIFASRYQRFLELFRQKGGDQTGVTPADAMLFYLSLYSYDQMDDKTETELTKEVERIWDEFSLLDVSPEQTLVLDPEESTDAGLFARFFKRTGTKTLKIAFVHIRYTNQSGWVYSHELGKTYLEQTFGKMVSCRSYFVENRQLRQTAIEKAISDGAHIIFTTSAQLLDPSLKAAVAHPDVKILNCCLNRPYKNIRTYYGRMYEAKFLEGMIAGAMADNDKIAYCADYPIFGAIASINAFARGAAMTNPRAKIYLSWLCENNSDPDKLMHENDIHIVSDLDTFRPGTGSRRYGLYDIRSETFENLAVAIWNWGKFYEKIIRDILFGNWNGPDSKKRPAMNYWWGISGEIVDLILSRKLTPGLAELISMVRWQISMDLFHPFGGPIFKQNGIVTGDEHSVLSPEEIISMDWLAQNVVGSIPDPSKINEAAKELISLQGINTAKEKI